MLSPGAESVALFRQFPTLCSRLPWVHLGAWPTPVEPLRLASGCQLWVKRDDACSSLYGGNKVRTLEAMLGVARACGAQRIWATGAYGSNHAVATLAHAPRAGLQAGAILFPQPSSPPARANLSAALSLRPHLLALASILELPLAMHRVRRNSHDYVMPPGGATTEGTFGALSAAFELATQVAARECPLPRRVVIAVGSTCTTAGLLAGLHAAARMGVWPGAVPIVHSVRVTPWPITSRARIAWLAQRTLHRLERLVGVTLGVSYRALLANLVVDRRFIGRGYGRATQSGRRALARFADSGAPPLDLVYSAKSAAALLALANRSRGPLLYWATKSSAPLPIASAADVAVAPARARHWLEQP